MQPNRFNRFYLETKASKSGHLMDFGGKKRLPEQADLPVIKGMDQEQMEMVKKLYKEQN
jgi:hypothetical protein